MRLLTSLSLLLAAGLSLANAPTAQEVLAKGATAAKKDGKNILVVFHASWCGWCKTLDKFLDTTDEGKMVKSGLEVVHLTVQENGAKKAEENEGGIELMKKWGSDQAGLPFMVVLDAKTLKPIINSFAKEGDTKTNTGYPAAPEEIAHFMKMLEKGAPKINADNRGKIKNWLVANAPKH